MWEIASNFVAFLENLNLTAQKETKKRQKNRFADFSGRFDIDNLALNNFL